MTAVRSKRLFGPTTVGTTGTVVYTCPAGETALLKDLEVGPGGAAGMVVVFYIGALSVDNRVHQVTLASNAWSSERGAFIVLHPGEQLRVASSIGTVSVSGHGAELEGVAD